MNIKNLNIILLFIVALALGGLISFFAFNNPSEKTCPEVFKAPGNEVADSALKIINENILQGQATASVANIVEEGNLYKITLKIEDQEFNSYATLDGKMLFPEGISIETVEPAETPEQPEDNSEEEPTAESLENFAKCLAEKGMKFYGASWCGWCKKEKELLGEAAVQLLYTECIDEATNEMKQECKDAGISGFPTWQLPDGTLSSGYKELDQLAEISGCSI